MQYRTAISAITSVRAFRSATTRAASAESFHALQDAMMTAEATIEESQRCQFIAIPNETYELASPQEAAIARKCAEEFLQSELALLAPVVVLDFARRFDNFMSKSVHTKAEVGVIQSIIMTNLPILTEMYADMIRLRLIKEESS